MDKYFKDKVVLITGHTGFKGGWLSMWLVNMGAKVVGVSNDIPSNPSIFSALSTEELVEDVRLDVRDTEAVKLLVENVQPDYVFHMAAQALVRPSYENPIETISTNALGSANILSALRFLSKKVSVVMITSDKVYDNVEWVWGYRETDELGGKDPYSASKGMAELAIRTFLNSFFDSPDSNIRIGVARAGNVIGGGDWATDRIVPDCIRAWSVGKSVDIRSPWATRPWQHVLEPLSGYLTLAVDLMESGDNHGEAYNFGPLSDHNYPVSDLINEMSRHWDKVKWNDISKSKEHVHEAGLLKLNCDKALSKLDWTPTLDFGKTVLMTVEWYKNYYQKQKMRDFTIGQINEYIELAKEQGIGWAKK